MSEKEKELSEEELEQAAGGLQTRRTGETLGEGGQLPAPRKDLKREGDAATGPVFIDP